jgi:eukaryotic-like serine/threonine-protein kinase
MQRIAHLMVAPAATVLRYDVTAMTPSGQLAGQTLAGRYEVLDLVGSGGMGEVYRARDRELDDLIALKIVRHELLVVPGVLERFRREIKLARRVTHGNVARAFDLAITDGLVFYTMELVEGSSLGQRLASGRPLEVGEPAAIASAVCDALAAAHDAGIIHRDVKPANILLGDDGRVVLTDFGVAAATRDELGEMSGTPRYMPPEQALGEPATAAADLYALGVVLFEMITGTPAFEGPAMEILATKLELEHLRVDAVDPRLAELVASATHRDPERRPRSAQGFRRALEPFVRATGRERSSIASISRLSPLPVVLVGPPAATVDRPHVAAGFHQMLLDRLAQWPRVRVAARGSRQIVGNVLVELAVHDDELVLNATSRPTALAARFPFEIESIAHSVEQAARLVAVLAGSDAPPPALRSHPTPPVALDMIWHARHEVRADRTALPRAIERCRRARDAAPGDARVTAALATSLAQLSFYGRDVKPSVLDEAAAHAFAALAADPLLADGYFARGHVELHCGRPVNAAACFRAAIAHAPLMGEAHEWLGRLLLEAGFVVDARERLDDAIGSAGLPNMRWDLVIADALAGRWSEVDRALADLHGIGVDGGTGYRMRLAAWRGDRDALVDAHAELAGRGPAATFERELMLLVFDPLVAWADRRDAIVSIVHDRRLASARRRAFVSQLAAEAAGLAGDVETCLSMLLRANAEGLFDLPWLDRCPVLATVRGEPRFAVIRRDVAARAEAIHDALHGERRDDASAATAIS